MKYLFFFVHPSKFHLFRNTINTLIAKGHHVEILITSKDVLEDLVKQEGWRYTNIFPEGRKMKNVSPLISAGINFFTTIFRLYKYTRGKKYDLFITDDLLVYIGRWRKIPSFVFNDDDLRVVIQLSLVLMMTDHVLAPDITDLEKYNKKKVGFPGYKELAYLHPNWFTPDINVIRRFNPELTPYFIIRLVSLRAFHDIGMKGISDEQVSRLIALLETRGKVYISAERPLPEKFEKYRLSVNPLDITHVLNFAQLFIGDSQTMTSEAAVLGTPAFRCNDFAGKISVMNEKEDKYKLSFNYSPADFDKMYLQIKDLLENGNFKEEFQERRMKMLAEKIDLSSFMIWLFENFPISVQQFNADPIIIENFKLK